jgi:hypothetical protein
MCIHASPVQRHEYARILPRKAEAMSLAGGKRTFGD